MNITGYFALSVLGLILFFTTSGYSIRCWVCNSKLDPACADPFDNRTLPLTDCALVSPRPPHPNLQFTLCGKIVQKSENNETVIHRVCAQEGENGACSASQLSLIYGKVENCTTCSEKSGCNSV